MNDVAVVKASEKSVVGYFDFALTKRKAFRKRNTPVLHAAISTEKPQIEPIQTRVELESNRPCRLRQTARPIVLAGS